MLKTNIPIHDIWMQSKHVTIMPLFSSLIRLNWLFWLFGTMQNCLVFLSNRCHKCSVQAWQRSWPRVSLHSNVRTSKYQTAYRYPGRRGLHAMWGHSIFPISIKLFLRSVSILIRRLVKTFPQIKGHPWPPMPLPLLFWCMLSRLTVTISPPSGLVNIPCRPKGNRQWL